MRFNKMTSYAIRVVARLSLEPQEIVTSSMLAVKEDIPNGVLMKVLSKLKKAGIIKSHQGRGRVAGGFSLRIKQEEISIYKLMSAMDGAIELYPVNDEESYEGELYEVYDQLRVMNNEYVERLSGFYYLDVLKPETS